MGTDTKVQGRVAAVVVVGCQDDAVAAIRKWVSRAVPAQVRSCGVNDAATTAAKWRPFALLIADTLYEFDRDEFAALARDVGAQLFPIPGELDRLDGLEDLLMPQLNEAFLAHDA